VVLSMVINKILGMQKGTAFIVALLINLSSAVLFAIKEKWEFVCLFLILSIICFYMVLGGWRN